MRLLKERRLVLLCDLDQTLIHTDVDPTLNEWMNDPTNPNYPALQVSFRDLTWLNTMFRILPELR